MIWIFLAGTLSGLIATLLLIFLLFRVFLDRPGPNGKSKLETKIANKEFDNQNSKIETEAFSPDVVCVVCYLCALPNSNTILNTCTLVHLYETITIASRCLINCRKSQTRFFSCASVLCEMLRSLISKKKKKKKKVRHH
jgi:hypothetical protein